MNKPVHAMPFPRWPFVALAVVVVVAAVVVLVTQLRSDGESGNDQIEKTATAQPANGCLGGTDPAEAVVTASRTAPHTADGAAAFLASYVRWQTRDPREGEPAAQTVGRQVWGQGVSAELREDAVERTSADGFHATIKGKHYSVREVRGPRVLVAMTVDLVDEDGAVAASSGTIGWVRLDSGAWKFDGLDTGLSEQAQGADQGRAFRAKLDEQGVPFQEAC